MSQIGMLGATVMPHNLYLHSRARADAADRPYHRAKAQRMQMESGGLHGGFECR